MYLEKLEAQGFKSFANKNVLVFPGMLDKSRRGITAVVGPNGSGKSNVADAVRWALGEQSMKTLRGKKSEDVIFSGSDRKGKLGMAEVSMHLNNEDRRAPIDFSEIVITRRLYRNGDSEYMLNNSRVRLSDIQMLLAKAKFGQKTYSVIGQGMVEGFLNTTLSERKEFFDEATGVKQYQIKRDDSLNKLRASYENLIQAQMLLSEIEPRLKSLTRQVSRLHKRGEIENDLKDKQLQYYATIWHEIDKKFRKYNNEFLELEKDKFAKDKKLGQLARSLEQLEVDSSRDNGLAGFQEELTRAQNRKDELNAKLARAAAQIEIKLEANGQFDLSFLINKKEELGKDISANEEEIETQEKRIKSYEESAAELESERSALNSRIDDINKKLLNYGEQLGEGEVKKINSELVSVLEKLRQASREESLSRLKEIILKAKERIKELLVITGGKDAIVSQDKWQEIHEALKVFTGKKEELLTKINENNLRITARTERVKLLQEKTSGLKEEINNIELKIKQKSEKFDYKELETEQDRIKIELEQASEALIVVKKKIEEVNSNEEDEKSRLFKLQKEMQALQNEVNLINNKLSELKINSTRYETKLEDLEVEVRDELGSLKEVRELKMSEEFDINKTKESIRQLKRQIELIGGIDPQIEEEYKETKERYDFLSSQVGDFTGAVSSLEKIIKELDEMIKERFDKEFKVIAGNFEKYFKVLFNGGNAKIIKVLDEDEDELRSDRANAPGEEGEEKKPKSKDTDIADIKKIKFLQKHNATGLAGIEIQATPPGKKIKSIAMLSGGERALTAIALICAIIYSNPSPFVVLDEVDAALDEANSERLASILDELSHKTQFIVITHNRATMRRANILYGVTMGNDGVSKLLSIKLDEATEQVRS